MWVVLAVFFLLCSISSCLSVRMTSSSVTSTTKEINSTGSARSIGTVEYVKAKDPDCASVKANQKIINWMTLVILFLALVAMGFIVYCEMVGRRKRKKEQDNINKGSSRLMSLESLNSFEFESRRTSQSESKETTIISKKSAKPLEIKTKTGSSEKVSTDEPFESKRKTGSSEKTSKSAERLEEAKLKTGPNEKIKS